MMLRFMLGFLFYFTASLMAHADAPLPMLRASVIVSADVVTLGDLFDHAGNHAEVAVFRSPRPGTRGIVTAEAVARAARAAGFPHIDLAGLRDITVERSGTIVTAQDMRDAVTDLLAHALDNTVDNLEITWSDLPQEVTAPGENTNPIIAELRRRPDNAGRFEAVLHLAGVSEPVSIAGRAVELAEVAVLTRTLSRGETLSMDAIRIERISSQRLPRRGVLGLDEAHPGLIATRTLRAGSMIAPGDLAPPPYVTRNSLVTIVFRTGTLQLTARGRALDTVGENGIVQVQNLQSNRVIQGVAEAPGIVVVTTGIGSLASLGVN